MKIRKLFKQTSLKDLSNKVYEIYSDRDDEYRNISETDLNKSLSTCYETIVNSTEENSFKVKILKKNEVYSFGEDVYNEEYYDVLSTEDGKSFYPICLTTWETVAGMEADLSGYSKEEFCAHIIWELTLFGFTQEEISIVI